MKKMKTKLILFFTFLISFSFTLSAQIKGKVIDEKGETIPGVNVVIKGTSTGNCNRFKRGIFYFWKQNQTMCWYFRLLDTKKKKFQ